MHQVNRSLLQNILCILLPCEFTHKVQTLRKKRTIEQTNLKGIFDSTYFRQSFLFHFHPLQRNCMCLLIVQKFKRPPVRPTDYLSI